MTEEQHLAELDAIAAALPSDPFGMQELRSLLGQLPAPTQPEIRSAREGVTEPAPGGSGIGQALSLTSATLPGGESGGVIGVLPELFYGQSNLLPNPVLDNHDQVTGIGTSSTPIAPFWHAFRVLNSGSITSIVSDVWFTRGDEGNPLNSTISSIFIHRDGNNAHDSDLYIENVDPVGIASSPLLGFLVASFRVWPLGTVLSSVYTSYFATVQLIDETSTTILAESTPFDLYNETEGTVRISIAVDASTLNPTHTFKARLRIHTTRVSSTNDVDPFLLWGEPVLAFAPTQQSPAYQPQIARWVPTELRWRIAGDSVDRLRIADRSASTPPKVEFGGGSGAADVAIFRSGVKELSIDDAMLVLGGTAFPTPVTTDALYYRTDLGLWFYYDGTRWLSAAKFTQILRNTTSAGDHPYSATTGANIQSGPFPSKQGGSDIWIVQHLVRFFVSGGTALSGSHKWVGTLQKSDASNSGFTIATTTIDSGASDNWRVINTSVGALGENGTSYFRWGTTWTKTGTPGTLTVHEEITYRIVAT